MPTPGGSSGGWRPTSGIVSRGRELRLEIRSWSCRPAGREREAPWSDHPELLARSVEPRAILYGALDEEDYTSLVWIGRNEAVPEEVVGALQPWREVLASRAEFERNARRRWFETAWARDKDELRKPKVISLHRTDRGRFAVDEEGAWQSSIKTTLCTPKGPSLSVAYLCGLLNSELLDLWYAIRGRTPWHVRRDYEPKPMAQIPYRHTDLEDTPRAARLRTALGGSEAEALDLGLAIADDLAASDDHAPEAAAALAEVVRAIAATRRALLPHRVAAPELTRIVKDPWRTDAVTVEPGPLVAEIPSGETVSVRLDPALKLEGAPEGKLGRPVLVQDRLEFRYSRQTTVTVTGPTPRLKLLWALVVRRDGLMLDDLERTLLPRDVPRFEGLDRQREEEIAALLDRGRALVELAERLVCRLYGVPSELEDAVIAHASERAAVTSGPEGD